MSTAVQNILMDYIETIEYATYKGCEDHFYGDSPKLILVVDRTYKVQKVEINPFYTLYFLEGIDLGFDSRHFDVY